MSCGRPNRDLQLVQIVDIALADTAHKAGEWLLCRPGCTQCCVGAFAINRLDVERLRSGVAELLEKDSERARRVQQRAREYVARVTHDFPGDTSSGLLYEDASVQQRFDSFANHEICPALDPETGTCDLYAFRPMTCRVFGPPVRNQDGGLGVCELCFHGATAEQIAACEMNPDPGDLENLILEELEPAEGPGNTIVAFALAR